MQVRKLPTKKEKLEFVQWFLTLTAEEKQGLEYWLQEKAEAALRRTFSRASSRICWILSSGVSAIFCSHSFSAPCSRTPASTAAAPGRCPPRSPG